MSSSVSNASSGSSKARAGYMEFYKVLYSPGERIKAGNRTWLDGQLTYYTINKKLILRSDRGVLMEECFNFSPPPFPPSTTGHQQQPIKEEGVRCASFPINVAFETSSHNYTIEIERVKFIHERTLDVAALRQTPESKKEAKKYWETYFENVEDILEPDLKPCWKPLKLKSGKSSDEESLTGQKRKAVPLSIQDANTIDNTTPVKRRFQTNPVAKSPSKSSLVKSINTPFTPHRARASGLSRTPKRS